MNNHAEDETTIYLIRHAQTLWNRERIAQGQMDSPLTEAGRKKTESLSPLIAALNPDRIYSSDLMRARTTAEILTKELKKTIHVDRALREMDFGVFSGKPWEYIETEMAEIHSLYVAGDPDFVIPEGESHNQFHARVIDALNRIVEENRGKRILIVTHGGALNNIISYIENVPSEEKRYFGTVNLGLNIIKHRRGQYAIEQMADRVEYSWTN